MCLKQNTLFCKQIHSIISQLIIVVFAGFYRFVFTVMLRYTSAVIRDKHRLHAVNTGTHCCFKFFTDKALIIDGRQCCFYRYKSSKD